MIDNLPTNPEIGDQFTTAKGVTYTYDGVKWKGSLVQQIAVAGPQVLQNYNADKAKYGL